MVLDEEDIKYFKELIPDFYKKILSDIGQDFVLRRDFTMFVVRELKNDPKLLDEVLSSYMETERKKNPKALSEDKIADIVLRRAEIDNGYAERLARVVYPFVEKFLHYR